MHDRWIIDYWELDNGESPIYDFIQKLDKKSQAKVYYIFELLENYGLQVGLPHVKKLTGTPLWEIRILGENNIRILYITVTQKKFLMLHGFKKKSQKTPTKEIKIALSRLLRLKNQ